MKRKAEEYECPVCNRIFLYHSAFSQHLEIHGDEKKYVCEECGKAFKQHAGLIRHRMLLVLTVTRLHMKQKESTLAKCVEIPSNVKERSPVIKLYILMCDLIRVISVKKHSET
jgi:DNA-directed RNA polymerase subunit RPC12/RpoP